MLVLLPHLTSANDAITLSNNISERMESLFTSHDFTGINEQEYKYRTTQSRLPDGRWELTFIYSKLGVVSKRGAEDEWKNKIKLVDEWINLTPNQPAPYLAKAEILINYAWDARGGSWAKTVTPEQWGVFHERIKEARKVLEESSRITKDNPYWYLKMEIIAKAQNWPEEGFDALYSAAVKAAPTYYFIHFRAADYYQPRWHGSRKKLREFVDNAVSNSKTLEGMTLYTRIYWSQLWALKNNTFSPGYAEWKNMRQGFEDIMQHHPGSVWNLNAYAFYACMANDWPTTHRLLNQINNRPHLSIWKSKSRYTHCKQLSERHHNKEVTADR